MHYGSANSHEMHIYGVDASFFDSISSEYFNPADYPRDPFNIGKSYSASDIFQILEDANDYSQTEDPWDSIKMLANNPNNKTRLSSNVYNFIVAEGLRGSIFSKVPDDILLCFIHGYEAQTDNIVEGNFCRIRLRARVMSSVYKLPGFNQFTGYKYAEFIKTDSFLSISQYKALLEEVFLRYPKVKEAYNKRLIDFPKSKDNIPKCSLMLKLKPGTTLRQRSLLKNNLLNFANDNSLVAFDSVTFTEDIEQRMGMLDFFTIAISFVCFILGFFQLIVSISANIRDSLWELGVLRAIGMTNDEILKITIYESLANNLSSIILGFLAGLIISISIVAQFLLYLELPFQLIVSSPSLLIIVQLPYKTFIAVSFMSVLTQALGSYFATRTLFNKKIANILKGK